VVSIAGAVGMDVATVLSSKIVKVCVENIYIANPTKAIVSPPSPYNLLKKNILLVFLVLWHE